MTKTNDGLALLGIAFFALLIMFAVATMPRTISTPKSASKTDNVKTVYAGTPSTGRYYDLACDGKIKPIGGAGTIDDLYNGDHNSNYFMARLNIIDAYNDATLNNTCEGMLSVKIVSMDNSQVVTGESLKNGDVFGEKPIFFRGMTTGWASFKVKPFMSENDLYNLIKY